MLKSWVSLNMHQLIELKQHLMFQGSRLDDQRCAAPPSVNTGPTVPDEDFFGLIARSQSNRMEEQRVPPPVATQSKPDWSMRDPFVLPQDNRWSNLAYIVLVFFFMKSFFFLKKQKQIILDSCLLDFTWQCSCETAKNAKWHYKESRPQAIQKK